MADKARLITCKERSKIWSIFIDFFRKSGVVFGCNMVYFSFAICN